MAEAASSRVELYRALSDAGRLRLLALCGEEELTVSEAAQVLDESQPQVSKKAAVLRGLGLLASRKEGTRSFLKTPASTDPVVHDALREGKRMCLEEGRLIRVHEVVRAREAGSVEFFEAEDEPEPIERGPIFSHLAALGSLFGARELAVDVGSGEGQTLDVLAPVYRRVIAVDRSRARLARAAARVQDRGFTNVSLTHGAYDDVGVIESVDRAGGANLVFAGRVLHHAARPAKAVESFARLLRPGGQLVLLEYAPHDDERMREQQADVWLGFSREELEDFCTAAALEVRGYEPIFRALHPTGPDAHLNWHVVIAARN